MGTGGHEGAGAAPPQAPPLSSTAQRGKPGAVVNRHSGFTSGPELEASDLILVPFAIKIPFYAKKIYETMPSYVKTRARDLVRDAIVAILTSLAGSPLQGSPVIINLNQVRAEVRAGDSSGELEELRAKLKELEEDLSDAKEIISYQKQKIAELKKMAEEYRREAEELRAFKEKVAGIYDLYRKKAIDAPTLAKFIEKYVKEAGSDA